MKSDLEFANTALESALFTGSKRQLTPPCLCGPKSDFCYYLESANTALESALFTGSKRQLTPPCLCGPKSDFCYYLESANTALESALFTGSKRQLTPPCFCGLKSTLQNYLPAWFFQAGIFVRCSIAACLASGSASPLTCMIKGIIPVSA